MTTTTIISRIATMIVVASEEGEEGGWWGVPEVSDTGIWARPWKRRRPSKESWQSSPFPARGSSSHQLVLRGGSWLSPMLTMLKLKLASTAGRFSCAENEAIGVIWWIARSHAEHSSRKNGQISHLSHLSKYFKSGKCEEIFQTWYISLNVLEASRSGARRASLWCCSAWYVQNNIILYYIYIIYYLYYIYYISC